MADKYTSTHSVESNLNLQNDLPMMERRQSTHNDNKTELYWVDDNDLSPDKELALLVDSDEDDITDTISRQPSWSYEENKSLDQLCESVADHNLQN